jgi:hypothetical protein
VEFVADGFKAVTSRNALRKERGAVVPIETLTQLQYSDDRWGPFALYIYEPGGEFHTGKQWFENVPRYPDEVISTAEAKARVEKVIAEKRHVRICDRGDMLVFHSEDGKILFGEKFWEEIT